MRSVVGVAALLAAVSCHVSCRTRKSAPTASAISASASASASAPRPEALPANQPGQASLPFIENDYARAIANARATHRPLFVDTWAAWCHTCMSMKAYVLTDPRMQRRASEFVWLAIDSERAENAAFLARFPSTSLPTLWVIDPATERAALKWIGTATVPELEAILDAAKTAVLHGTSGGEAAAAFISANQASAAGEPEDAIAQYKHALATAPSNWAQRPQAVEALSMRLNELERHDECVDLAASEVGKLPPGTSLANVVENGLMSAYSLPAGAPARAKVPALLAEARRIAADPTQPILADDRSGIYEHVVEVLRDRNDPEEKTVAAQWATFLEQQAANAPTPEARAVFDSHRLLAYIELGTVAEKAVPMLKASERDLPTDYNPPARLARAYLALHKNDDARAAIDRALARAYGPRKLQIYLLKADIETARGDRGAARNALKDAASEATSMHLSPKYARIEAELTQRLAALTPP